MKTQSIGIVAALVLLGACSSDLLPPGSTLPVGDWGGEGAGILMSDQGTHVHIGCTYGDFPASIALSEHGEFDVSGSYLLRAYPIAVGPTMPAHLKGRLDGKTVTMTVVVTDTVADTTVTKGPATVVLGQEPQMGPCPICRVPAAWMTGMLRSDFVTG